MLLRERWQGYKQTYHCICSCPRHFYSIGFSIYKSVNIGRFQEIHDKFSRNATIYCKEIPFNCFAYCYNLSSVTIKSPVTSVGVEAFLCCYRLESITFPAGLEYIDRKAISDCKNLKSVILTCSRINASAFSGSCERLKEVIITSETPPTITVPSSSGWTEAALFSGVPSNAVLIVPDRTKYLQEPWTSSFSEIKSFLPTNEKTYAFYNLGVSGWGWPGEAANPLARAACRRDPCS